MKLKEVNHPSSHNEFQVDSGIEFGVILLLGHFGAFYRFLKLLLVCGHEHCVLISLKVNEIFVGFLQLSY